MPNEITRIQLRYGMTVNAYLIKINDGFILIDTGFAQRRAELLEALDQAGCQRGDLKWVLVTHGDPDHVGNCTFLHADYGAKIAMHQFDSGMVERGDMTWNRGLNVFAKLVLKMVGVFIKCETFKADRFLETGKSLQDIGWDAVIIHIPGHTRGSIGFLTADGNLFCGDLLNNIRKPTWHIITDKPAAKNSLAKLRTKSIQTVYPGHGDPFAMQDLAID